MTRTVLLAGWVSKGKGPALEAALTTDWTILACDPAEEPERFRELAPQADAIVGGHINAPWPATPDLKLFQIPFTGFDFLAPEKLPKGTACCNTYEHESSIAEYILLAMLEWEIGLRHTDRKFREVGWDGKGAAQGPVHGEVRDKVVGIIGHGHIGREVAIRARAFGMTVTGVGRREMETPPELDRYETVGAGLERLLAESDYVVVCCPLNDATRGMMNAERFGQMKPTGVVINVARGPVLEEEALYNALATKQIGGAVIDVWYQYPNAEDRNPPPSRFPFQDLDNLIMTPHNSGWTQEQIDRRWRFVASNLDRLARGEPLLNVVFEGTRQD
jgi:phosphoglycerate dehydrogenase-like enzyme